MTTKRVEPQGVREVHEIRERLYEERKSWTEEERRQHVERVGGELAQRLGLRIVHHQAPRVARKLA